MQDQALRNASIQKSEETELAKTIEKAANAVGGNSMVQWKLREGCFRNEGNTRLLNGSSNMVRKGTMHLASRR